MRISEVFGLGQSQGTLSFIDVDTEGDTRLFVDPWALRHLDTAWGHQCVALIQDFFATVLELIAQGHDVTARAALVALREPNEAHLGLSAAESQGRGLGPHLASEIFDRLRNSRARKSGLLSDVEDSLLFIDGVGPDIISDITINLIRGPLIEFTQQTALHVGMPLTQGVASGAIWAINTHQWRPSDYTQLPTTSSGKILLVPKVIVRKRLEYDVGEYYRHYVLEHLQSAALAADSELVQLLKNGRRVVHKNALERNFPQSKSTNLEQTLNSPSILSEYKADKSEKKLHPLSHEELTASIATPLPDWGKLLKDLLEIPTGASDSAAHEKAVGALLTALFYPQLAAPEFQARIHDGRKRIDIKFLNTGSSGFWSWIGTHYSSANIFVECKNYAGEVANPELDQLAGRFSPRRGNVGILVCREFDDKLAFIRRCRDTADDGRGFILPIDDTDIRTLIDDIQKTASGDFPLLRERFNRLIL